MRYWRWLAMAGALVLLVVAAGMFWGQRAPAVASDIPAVPAAEDAPLLTRTQAAPEASPQTREARRFSRYDRDRDASVSREEYLAARRKAFARLDVNGDGRLGFDEWAVKATTKFAAADGDRSGVLTAAEFATTAVKRKAKAPCVASD